MRQLSHASARISNSKKNKNNESHKSTKNKNKEKNKAHNNTTTNKRSKKKNNKKNKNNNNKRNKKCKSDKKNKKKTTKQKNKSKRKTNGRAKGSLHRLRLIMVHEMRPPRLPCRVHKLRSSCLRWSRVTSVIGITRNATTPVSIVST